MTFDNRVPLVEALRTLADLAHHYELHCLEVPEDTRGEGLLLREIYQAMAALTAAGRERRQEVAAHLRVELDTVAEVCEVLGVNRARLDQIIKGYSGGVYAPRGDTGDDG